MDRFLLFDSGCSLCSALASEIERETDGWLTARSLRDQEVQAWLDRAQPGWHWEPTLLEAANVARGGNGPTSRRATHRDRLEPPQVTQTRCGAASR